MRPVELLAVLMLDRECMPNDDPYYPGDDLIWVAIDDGRVVGFGALRLCRPEGLGSDAVYLSRAGVAASHRGRGIQQRLIRARLRWARALGRARAITDTCPDNAASARSLIRCGFRPFVPRWTWAGEWWNYWLLDLAPR